MCFLASVARPVGERLFATRWVAERGAAEASLSVEAAGGHWLRMVWPQSDGEAWTEG